jgi:hypothetical protein
MIYELHGPANRLRRRTRRTRAALISAAQGFIALGRFNVRPLGFGPSADVGMGSFHNHFDSKMVALNGILGLFGALFGHLPPGDDPTSPSDQRRMRVERAAGRFSDRPHSFEPHRNGYG